MATRKKRASKRVLRGGLWWECQRPGHWRATTGEFSVYHMLAGTSRAAWEVFAIMEGKDNAMGPMVGQGMTMPEAIDAACRYALDEFFEEQKKKWPRQRSY